MPLSPEQEWTLVACGLVAHADGVLEVGEWDEVLRLLDERVATDEVEPWIDLLSDESALRRRFDELAPPAPFMNQTILEKAWRMALADGGGTEAELAIHDEVAQKLGADPGEVAAWRRGWDERAHKRAEVVAGFAALLAGSDGVTEPMERAEYEDLLRRLPLAEGRRDALEALIDAPPEKEALIGATLGLEPEDRGIALAALVPIVKAAGQGKIERALFLELAERVAVDRDQAERLLER
jgi:tellurite resistance protein